MIWETHNFSTISNCKVLTVASLKYNEIIQSIEIKDIYVQNGTFQAD